MAAMADQRKPLLWVGSSRKDLLAMPDDVVAVFGFALHLAQTGKKHEQTKLLKGFGGASVLEVVEDRSHGRYVPGGLHGQDRRGGLRVALFPEEVQARDRNAKAGDEFDSGTFEGGARPCQRSLK